MSISGQGHSLTLVKGHSDFKVKWLNFGLYTQVSDSGPLGPLVNTVILESEEISIIFAELSQMTVDCNKFLLPLEGVLCFKHNCLVFRTAF